jgi:hypothetical protein
MSHQGEIKWGGPTPQNCVSKTIVDWQVGFLCPQWGLKDLALSHYLEKVVTFGHPKDGTQIFIPSLWLPEVSGRRRGMSKNAFFDGFNDLRDSNLMYTIGN